MADEPKDKTEDKTEILDIPADNYPPDLKELLEKNDLKVREIEAQRTTLAKELESKDKALLDLQQQVLDLNKKLEAKETKDKPTPQLEEVLKIAETTFNSKLEEINRRFEERNKEVEHLKAELESSRLLAERERIIRESNGNLVVSLLDGAKTVDDLRKMALVAKAEYQKIVDATTARLRESTFPDPSAGLKPSENKLPETVTEPKGSAQDEVNAFLDKNGADPTKYSAEAKSQWDALKKRAKQEAGIA